MKQKLTTLALVVMIIFTGCVDLDDIYRRLDEQEREIATMKALINAINKKISVESYMELADKSGYELTMSDGSKITLKHGVNGEQGIQGPKGEQGEQGEPGQDGDAYLTITETDDTVIITYKGVVYAILKSVPPNTINMTLTTTKSVGSTILLRIDAAEADRHHVWIDLNNNGTKDDNEGVTNFDSVTTYALGDQIVTVYGKVSHIYCDDNQLTSLDLSNNAALKVLYCNSNQLTSLDLSKNKALVTLVCDHNQLASLDVSKNTALESLFCDNNYLTFLDLSQNTALANLFCDNNQLSILDLFKNSALEFLSCRSNQITLLGVTKNFRLVSLFCDNNQLTGLDVSNNPALKNLHCYGNQLTSLDLSRNDVLRELYCYDNKISGTNMTALVNSLPARNSQPPGLFRVFAEGSAIEQNIINTTQAATAESRNWPPRNSNGNPFTPAD
jgi:hypothetical protein